MKSARLASTVRQFIRIAGCAAAKGRARQGDVRAALGHSSATLIVVPQSAHLWTSPAGTGRSVKKVSITLIKAMRTRAERLNLD